MDPIEQFKADKKRMDAQVKASGRDLFKPFFTKLFVDYPTVQVVRWTQHTPYFNDGDPCVFGVGEIDASTTPYAEMKEPSDYDADTWCDGNAKSDVNKAAHEVSLFFQDIDEILQRAFGDGVQVFIERSGEITIEDYNHD